MGGSDHRPCFLTVSGLNKLVSEPKPRWNVDKDDWDLFAEVFESKIGDSKPTGNVDRDFVTYRRAMTLRAIPRGKVFNYSASYKDPEVREAVSKRQSASEAYRLNPTVENHAADKKARERAERLTCKAQTCEWRTFLLDVGPTTPTTELWHALKGIQAKRDYKCPGRNIFCVVRRLW